MTHSQPTLKNKKSTNVEKPRATLFLVIHYENSRRKNTLDRGVTKWEKKPGICRYFLINSDKASNYYTYVTNKTNSLRR